MAAATLPTTDNRVKDLLALSPVIHLEDVTKENFLKLIALFPEHQFEREPNGFVTLMPPTYGGTGNRELTIGRRVGNWAELHNLGACYSPSTGFDLPSGATKSPDVAWLSDATLGLLSVEDIEENFVPAVPDFVAEIRSKSDRLEMVQKKMLEIWIANGVRLGWLIDPYSETAWVYRANGTIDKVEGFSQSLSGEDVLPGFVLDLAEFRVQR
ncbi:MAG: Uma2 family endonuclease [Saprospiraceae bacterium]